MSKRTPREIINELIRGFDKSGQTEVEILVEMCKDHIHNERDCKDDIDKDSLDLLDTMLIEVADTAAAMRRKLVDLRAAS